MKETISAMKKVFERFKNQYEDKELEDLVFNYIIILAWTLGNPYWESEKMGFLDFEYEKIKKIIKEDLFQQLRKALPVEPIEIESFIPTIYENIVREQHRERLGIYYTPQWLVKYVVNNSIGKDLEKMSSVDSIRILEPACGAGMFLIYVFDILYNWYINNSSLSKEEIVKRIIQDNLYGIDIDQRALKLCKYTLYMKVLKITKRNANLKFNLFSADFLMKDSLNNISFDYVIGNPPYLENRRINKFYNKNDLKKRFKTAVGRFDIYSLFIEKSLELAKNKGIVAFVLPGNLLTNNNFSIIRQLILKRTDILEIIDLGDGIFFGVNMNMAIIILEKSNNDRVEHLIKCKNLRGDSSIQKSIYKLDYRLIPQNYYNNIMENVFDINSSEVTFKLREKVFKKGYTKLNDVCEIIAGIATGNVRNKLLTRNCNIPNAKKVLEGKSIDSYFHKWDGLYFIDDKGIIDKSNGEYATFMRQEFIDEEKILIRQTADRFICTFEEQGLYLLNTLYSLKVREDYINKVNLKYVLGLLNSKLYSFLYRSIVGERGKLFPQVKIFHIQNSPIVIAEKELQDNIIEKVDKIMSIKKQMDKSEATSMDDNSELTKELSRLVHEVDFLVYSLFRLTSEEIREIEEETTF